ncbi:hypothetical protein D3C75_1276630 [compost metagenome]
MTWHHINEFMIWSRMYGVKIHGVRHLGIYIFQSKMKLISLLYSNHGSWYSTVKRPCFIRYAFGNFNLSDLSGHFNGYLIALACDYWWNRGLIQPL